MTVKIEVKIPLVPQGVLGRLADRLMKPLMLWLQGNYRESPQETHFWNNRQLDVEDVMLLDHRLMVGVSGDMLAGARKWLGFVPVFHMPRFGGWKRYVVLAPTQSIDQPWFIGWESSDIRGVSLIPVASGVRVLRGPRYAQFFGLLRDGTQIEIMMIGQGVIGDGGPHVLWPLR